MKESSLDNIMSEDLSIFKVPEIVYRHNPLAYNPNAFSIGPFRHGQDKLIPTQKIKRSYFQGLLSRSGDPESLQSKLTEAVVEISGEARQYYEGPIECTMEKFAQMVALSSRYSEKMQRRFQKNHKTRFSQDQVCLNA